MLELTVIVYSCVSYFVFPQLCQALSQYHDAVADKVIGQKISHYHTHNSVPCSYLDHLGGGVHKPDADKYSVFYSLCQAVFYVFVFKHRSLLEMEGGR